MQKDVSPCRGCTCTTCAKSVFNGAMYLCPIRACDNCEKGQFIIKRSYCEDCVQLEDYRESADDFRL